jgi:peptidyl-Lys metalloendopeptidase
MHKFKSVMFAMVLAMLLLAALVGSGTAAQPGGATVELRVDQTAFAADQGVTIHVTLRNDTSRPIKVLKWYTPAEDVEEPLFTVTRDGVAVEFTGPHYKRQAPTGNDYLVLKPGESLNRAVDLAAWYDLSLSGNYAISYDIGSWNLYSEKGNAFKTVDSLQSASLNLKIDGRASALLADAAAASTTFNKCTTTQQSDLTTARAQASTYAANALSYLNGNNQGARYTTWFGTYVSSRYTTVKSHFSAISNAMDTAAIKFDCGCKKTYYAYVYPNQPYNIYLCKAFWTAPMTGTDSKAGTLIHEMSHFTVVAGTDDWAYGQTNAKNLAISDPTKAVDNADNHEYFAENTPALP